MKMGKEGMSEEDKREIAERFRKIRNNAGMSQERFAEELDISVSTVKKIELNKNCVSREIIRRLNRKFNVSSDYILFGNLTDKEQVWKQFLNCSGTDKVVLFMRMLTYFVEISDMMYAGNERPPINDSIIEKILEEIQRKNK